VNKNSPLERSLERIRRYKRQLEAGAHRARKAKARKEAANDESAQLRVEHPEHGPGVVWPTAKITFAVLFAAALYLLDFFLLAGLVRFVVADKFGGSEAMVTAGRILMPFVVLVVEVVAAILLHRAAQQVEDRVGSNMKVAACAALGLVPPAAVVGLVIANYQVGRYGFPLRIDIPVVGALLCLGVIGHLLILIGWDWFDELAAERGIRSAFAKAAHAADAAEAECERQVQGFTDLIDLYRDHLTTHNRLFPRHQLKPGPFSREVWDFIVVIYGGGRPPAEDPMVMLGAPHRSTPEDGVLDDEGEADEDDVA